MAHLYFTLNGTAYRKNDGATTLAPLAAPAGASLVNPAVRPVLFEYRLRRFNVGQFDRMVVLDESGALRPGGVTAPATTPVLADGAVPGSSLGDMIAYQTFAVKVGAELIAESNPGPASNTLASAGTGRVTTNLDNAPTDAHVTHTRLYISVDGSIPALADEQAIAGFTGTVTENVDTAALGVTLPVKVNLDGTVTLDINARGVPPYCKYAEKYHDAVFYAGDPDHPERIYYSRMYEPEAVNTTPVTVNGVTEYPWLTTKDGMPVTGLRRVGDELFVGKAQGADAIQGYGGSSDYSIRELSQYWGVISHFAMRVAGPSSALYFVSRQGPTMYLGGQFRFLGGPIETWWRDNYAANPALFEACEATTDRHWRSFRLRIPWTPSGTLYLNGDYFAAEGDQPIWTFDWRDRNDTCVGELKPDQDNLFTTLYVGSDDGYVRLENVAADDDDDGDTFRKKMTTQSGHRFMGDQAGDASHGFTFHELDVFLKHENQAATVSLYAGDDTVAAEARAAQKVFVLDATAEPAGKVPLVTPTSEHRSGVGISGKGVTVKIEVEAPVDVEYRGWGVEYTTGPQSRPIKGA